MKLTESKLKRVIQEELNKVLNEQETIDEVLDNSLVDISSVLKNGQYTVTVTPAERLKRFAGLRGVDTNPVEKQAIFQAKRKLKRAMQDRLKSLRKQQGAKPAQTKPAQTKPAQPKPAQAKPVPQQKTPTPLKKSDLGMKVVGIKPVKEKNITIATVERVGGPDNGRRARGIAKGLSALSRDEAKRVAKKNLLKRNFIN